LQVSETIDLIIARTYPAHVAEANPSELWRHDFFYRLGARNARIA
jgi:hypothetical protein